MLRELIIFLAGMGVSGLLVGTILFVKMGRENAALKKSLLKIANGVAHGNAMQQTIHGPELDARSVEFQRTRAMAQRDLGLETDDEMIASGD
jgi:hypothetical protein